MAGVSSRFRAIFEENPSCKVVTVPIVDYETLKKIVKFIYSGSVAFENREELDDFRTALDILRLEVPGSKVLEAGVSILRFGNNRDPLKGMPSVGESKGTETDGFNQRPCKEMEQESPSGKEHEGSVKEKQQEDIKQQDDSKGHEEGKATSMDSEGKEKLVSRSRSSSRPRGQLSLDHNLLSSR